MSALTRLRRPLRRVIKVGGGEVVVTMFSDGTIKFRELRTRQVYCIDLTAHFTGALRRNELHQETLALDDRRTAAAGA